jgi:CheY-like chemotaxis protein
LDRLRILVVDDNAQMRTIIGTVLAAAGIRQLYYAPTGQKGLESLQLGAVDVVFVDYEMPSMNGLDFLSAVRSLPGDKKYVPIIMLTGHSDMLRLNAARDRGVNEFLAKPVTARNILLRLGRVIDHPRDFVECAAYVGPDRRRRQVDGYGGPFRRRSDASARVEL